MAGTIVADIIQSDQSYASSINIASPMVVSNTISFNNTLSLGSSATISGNVNIDSGTFFVDSVGNKIGVGTTTPNTLMEIVGAEASSNVWLTVRNSTNAEFGGYGVGIKFKGSAYSDSNEVMKYAAIYANTEPTGSSDGWFNKVNLNFMTKPGVGSDPRITMRITHQGYVQMPYQPYARGSAGSGSTSVIGIDTYVTARGIATSSNRFTVPVAGAYVVGYHHLGNSGSGNCQVVIRKNGSTINGSRTQDTNSSNDSFGTQIIVELAKDDYVDFYCNQGQTHGNSDYNSMWIWLLG